MGDISLISLPIFVLVLSLLVFVHELGHFLAARWVGVPVVKDRMLLYLWAGRLMLWTEQGAMEVERYVPEQWQVHGDRVVYLDINRELRSMHISGKREQLATESNISRFDLYGDAVVYPSPAGGVVVVCNRKRYTY